METSGKHQTSISRKQALLKLQLAAVEKWLSYPSHSEAHPIIGFAADRYFRTRGVNFVRAHIGVHSLLEGLSSEPIFEGPELIWGRMSEPKITHIVKAFEQCEPKIVVTLNTNLSTTLVTPEQPNLIQQRFLEFMADQGSRELNEWLWETQRKFVEFLQSAMLELCLDSAEERWSVLFLADPAAFAKEIADRVD